MTDSLRTGRRVLEGRWLAALLLVLTVFGPISMDLDYPQIAGTASALLGAARFAFGGLAAPFVGVAGPFAILPLGLVTAVSVALAAVAALIFRTPCGPSERSRRHH